MEPAQANTPIHSLLTKLHATYRGVTDGHLADYIPDLAKADPDHFGIAIVTADGGSYAVGDCDTPFTIQSISKAFVFGLALQDHGLDHVLSKVGVEPSGDAFNSIIFDERANRPFNPMVNAGAIATSALVKGDGAGERLGRILAFFEKFIGHPVKVDREVFLSEKATGHRNRAIAHLELNFGMIDERVEDHLDLYFQQCSILVTCRDLGIMAATLANNGVNPITGERALDQRYVKNVIAVMNSCGMYDYSGEWSYRIGLPAKSGVGGGIIATLPGQLGIGVFSPPLDERGNSVRGIKVCEDLSQSFGLHIFDVQKSIKSVVKRQYDGANVGSKRLRGTDELAVLEREGGRIAVFELQGDLFFASVEQLVRRIARSGGASHIILDCRRIDHVDPPAARLIRTLADQQVAAGRKIRLAHLLPGDDRHGRLVQAGMTPDLFLADVDQALEWAEEDILARNGRTAAADAELPLAGLDLMQGIGESDLALLANVLEKFHFPAGAVIFREGDPADRLYFLAKGTASIHLTVGGARTRRIATLGPGVAFGEMALVDGAPRSAEVRTDSDAVAYGLPISRLTALGRDHPGIQTAILLNLSRLLSQRLRKANDEIRTWE